MSVAHIGESARAALFCDKRWAVWGCFVTGVSPTSTCVEPSVRLISLALCLDGVATEALWAAKVRRTTIRHSVSARRTPLQARVEERGLRNVWRDGVETRATLSQLALSSRARPTARPPTRRPAPSVAPRTAARVARTTARYAFSTPMGRVRQQEPDWCQRPARGRERPIQRNPSEPRPKAASPQLHQFGRQTDRRCRLTSR